MRVLFFGSGSFGLPTLQALCAAHEVVAVVTQPDKPAGRKRVLTPTPIGEWAQAQGMTVHKATDVNEPGFVEQIAGYGVEASVVIAFGQKLGEPLLAAMGKLAVNLHASLLPLYRGAAPINWAMIDGHPTTGVSVIGLAQRMDAGPVYETREVSIDPRETAGELHDRLAGLGPDAVAALLGQLATDQLRPVVQNESLATKARKFVKQDGTVDFNQPAPAVRARVHGLTPWPGCKVLWHDGAGASQPLTLLRVQDLDESAGEAEPGAVMPGSRIACAQGTVRPIQLQLPGKRAMSLDEFIAGRPLLPGHRLSPIPAG